LYAVLLVSALAFAALIVKEIIAAFESGEHAEHGLHDARVFELAWPVFLLSGFVTLIAGVATLIASKLLASVALTHYAAWALGYCGLAVVVAVLVEVLG
jgi:hypothetical protein